MKLKIDIKYESIEDGTDTYRPHPRVIADMDIDIAFLEFLRKHSPDTLEIFLNVLRKTSSEISRAVQVS